MDKDILATIIPDDGFSFFSGYTANLHNLPTIFASCAGFTVVGKGFREIYDNLKEGFQAYKKLLKKNGYEL